MKKASTEANSDRELIVACQKGERGAFERLFRRFGQDVFAMAMKLAGSKEEAEEVAQEVFISVHRNIDRFAFQSAFTTWLYRIVVRRAADRFRKNRRHVQNQVPIDDDDLSPGFQLQDDGFTPRDMLLDGLREETLERAIHMLNPKHRAVIVLRYVNDLSYEEIADVLECRIGTVKSRLNRAHALLREKLNELGFTNEPH